MAYGFNNDRSKAEMYTKEEIDAMEAQETSTRASADTALGNRIDNILDNQDLDPNKDSELVDIRDGYDGTLFASAGEAVRKSVSDARYYSELVASVFNYFDKPSMIDGGYIDQNNGQVVSYADWSYSDYIPVPAKVDLCFTIWSGVAWTRMRQPYIAFYDIEKTYISGLIVAQNSTFAAPNGAVYMRISIGNDALRYYPMVVKYTDWQNLSSLIDYKPFGNIGKNVGAINRFNFENSIVRNPYFNFHKSNTYFRYDTIVTFYNDVLQSYDFDFDQVKNDYPDNWTSYNDEKIHNVVILTNLQNAYLNLKDKKVYIFTETNMHNIGEEYVLLIGFDYATKTCRGLIPESYVMQTTKEYNRVTYESLSSSVISELYDQIQVPIRNMSDDDFCFSWLSDNHMTPYIGTTEADMTDMAIGEVDKIINFDAIINTGDSVMERDGISPSKALAKICRFFPSEKFIFCQGNHDRGTSAPFLGYEAFYNIVYRQTKSDDIHWGSKFDSYYYRDFPAKKIRVVVLNVYILANDGSSFSGSRVGYTNDQLEWLANTALDVDNDWHVIVLTHDAPVPLAHNTYDLQKDRTAFIDILKSFKYGTSVNVTNTDSSGLFNVNVQTHFNTSGNLIAVLSGHAHCDDSAIVEGINYVQITSAYIDVANVFSGYRDRPALSSQAYAFDIGVVNTSQKTLTLYRIGYGENRTFNY